MPAKTARTTLDSTSILDELRRYASDSYKRILLNHGVREPVLGVKVEYIKRIQKRAGTNYQLALDLFDTGVYDAQYLAGLIADDARMTKRDLTRWVSRANSPVACTYAVAWVAAGSEHGWHMAMKWIESKKPEIAATGWSTLAGIVAVRDDADLDLPTLERLLDRVARTIHDAPNGVRYVMNGFVIAVGCHVAPLTAAATKAAKRIGEVEVDTGNTSCKVPDAAAYIEKVRQRGTIGKKRKTVKC